MTLSLARAAWLLAMLLAVGIAAEITLKPAPPIPAATLPPLPRTDRGGEAAEPVAAYTGLILGRPLFNPDRRPKAPGAAPSPAAAGQIEPPRLAGILMTPTGRSAIFATADSNGRGTVVGEGGSIGAWQVEAIHAGDVQLAGPNGRRTVRPTFSSSGEAVSGLPQPARAGILLPQLPQLDTRPLNQPPSQGAPNFFNTPATPAARTSR